MKLSCVIPATDSPPTLDRCVKAIEGAERAPEELIVIDAPHHWGPAAARNGGARGASGEVLVFVDADVIVHADAIARIRAAFEADPCLTAIFGSYDDAPEAPDAVSGFRNLLHHHVHNQSAGAAYTFWAGLGAVRRDAFLAVGGFDAIRFPHPSVEDIELGMRLAAGGERIRLDPGIQGKHLKRWGLVEMVRTDYSRRGVPWMRLLVESRALPTTLNLGLPHRVGAGASMVAVGALCARRPRLAGGALLVLAALNAQLYRLLWRRGGLPHAVAGLGLHATHHLTAAAAAVTALADHLVGGASPSRRPARYAEGTENGKARFVTEAGPTHQGRG